jgi:hypothetical protein
MTQMTQIKYFSLSYLWTKKNIGFCVIRVIRGWRLICAIAVFSREVQFRGDLRHAAT